MFAKAVILLPVRSYLRTANSVSVRHLYCTHLKSSSVRVLYDGECPVCVKEIHFLQFLQKNRPNKVDFVDISLQDYDGAHYGGISYDKAMEEMHVIDENDQV
ncbi:hypothetical protein AALO_G00059720 [Alosa alosa]|uniref:Thioredoxin-like protein n=1 Tax=Alosa alosa TaxID=278164 RepID=A0AAV6H9W3_9TELE|nr:hypothetical protein AALO_G00059720 [Alosa alosa]